MPQTSECVVCHKTIEPGSTVQEYKDSVAHPYCKAMDKNQTPEWWEEYILTNLDSNAEPDFRYVLVEDVPEIVAEATRRGAEKEREKIMMKPERWREVTFLNGSSCLLSMDDDTFKSTNKEHIDACMKEMVLHGKEKERDRIRSLIISLKHTNKECKSVALDAVWNQALDAIVALI